MTTNWKNLVEKQHKQTYRWPKGWDTREEVAEQLECSPERVNTILGPGIRAGEVESQAFPVYDEVLKRVVKVVGYRTKPAKDEVPVRPPVDMDDLKAVIKAIRARRKDLKTPAQIQKMLPQRFRGVVSTKVIAEIIS